MGAMTAYPWSPVCHQQCFVAVSSKSASHVRSRNQRQFDPWTLSVAGQVVRMLGMHRDDQRPVSEVVDLVEDQTSCLVTGAAAAVLPRPTMNQAGYEQNLLSASQAIPQLCRVSTWLAMWTRLSPQSVLLMVLILIRMTKPLGLSNPVVFQERRDAV
jgi:hypothetical protein